MSDRETRAARLRELARDAAFQEHCRMSSDGGHDGPFIKCTHSDCVLVRDPAPEAARSEGPRETDTDVIPRRWKCPDCGMPNKWDALECVRCRLIQPPDRERWEFKAFVRSPRERMTETSALPVGEDAPRETAPGWKRILRGMKL